MFRLNRLTDYAVVVMMQMTHKPQEVYTAPQLATDTGIPLPTVAKLLNALARESLVASHRGALGGYTLSQSGGDITVAEIIQALEGPIALTACVDGSGNHCEVETLCPMRGHWDRVNQAIRGALSQVTLTDMAASCVGLFPEAGDLHRESRTDKTR
jgi:FeS assembly SUF system regulator